MVFSKLKRIIQEWGIKAQLEGFLILTVTLSTLIFLLMTMGEVQYYKSQIEAETKDIIESRIKSITKNLLEVRELNVKNFFESKENFLSTYKQLFERNELCEEEPTWHDDDKKAECGVFYISSSLVNQSRDDIEQAKTCNETCDVFKKGLTRQVDKFYVGFGNGLLYLYPEMRIEGDELIPREREWYYGSINNNNTNITEPYGTYEDEKKSVITLSSRIDSDRVAGIDIGLKELENFLSVEPYWLSRSLTEELKEVQTFEDKNWVFEMLVSERGLIVTNPSKVSNATSINELNEEFNSTNFGKNCSDMGDYQYGKKNGGKDYKVICKEINLNNYTYYYLLLVNQTKIEENYNNIVEGNNYLDTSFYTVLGIVLFLLLLMVLLIYWIVGSIVKELEIVQKILERMIKGGLFGKLTSDLRGDEFEELKNGVPDLVESLKYKITQINQQEDSFQRFRWRVTRPSDEMLYDNWETTIYSRNELRLDYNAIRKVIQEIS